VSVTTLPSTLRDLEVAMNEILRSPFTRVLTMAALMLVGLGLSPIPQAVAQSGYVVEDLGTLPGDASAVAWAINARGDVVGWSNGPNGTRAFLYTDSGGIVELPGLPDRPRTVARDINDAGDIVGSANAGGTDLGHAVLWANGAPARDLGTLEAGFYSEAWGINNVGQVVGSSHVNGGSFGVHAFLYTPAGGLQDLTPNSDAGYAKDINDAGQVTGYKTAFGGYHAFRWQAGTSVDLGVLPGFAHSFGWAINASGVVTGSSSSATGNSERLFRSIEGGGLQDLGGTGEHNVGLGINASGVVVGATGQSSSRAVVYTDAAGLRNLNTLIDPSLGWVLLAANDVNDAGQIVGYGFNNYTGQTHAVRLQPTDTPPAPCSFQCLRSTSIQLSSRRVRKVASVVGDVTVADENGTAVPAALVLAKWTLPDGSERDQYVSTNSNGVAMFVLQGPSGLYTLRIVNIQRSLYTFDPRNSVMSQSLLFATRK
jgi:probable HAF family extracellular repeat protein